MRDVTDGVAKQVRPVARVVSDLTRLLDGPARESQLPIKRVAPEITEAILAGRPTPVSNLALQVDSALEDGSLEDSGVSRSVLQRVADLDPSGLREAEARVLRFRPYEAVEWEGRAEPGAPDARAQTEVDDCIALPADYDAAAAGDEPPVEEPNRATVQSRARAIRSPAFGAPKRIDYGTLFTRLRQGPVTASAS